MRTLIFPFPVAFKEKKSAQSFLWPLLSLIFLTLPLSNYAQKSVSDSTISMVWLDISYRGNLPGGDLAGRLGYTSLLGVDMSFKLANPLYFSIGVHYLFSDSVDLVGVLDPLLVPGGVLVTDNGLLTDTRTLGTGIVVPLSVGVLLPIVPRPNPNSGLFVEVGGQYLHHKISIRPTEDEVAGLSDEYKKGYDRFTSGIGFREAIGYRYVANDGYVNFAIGLDFGQHFTRSRRSIDFSTGMQDTSQRL
ncbi:MAG: hypothetical protein AAF399_20305, partial [Bacteroidota bacterium]